ncbi:growth/differentiation factor 10 [Gouania willdenowi]|uniref:Growth/differentiation factor 10 n=1 Tax=Gouania willdenowi TaxID=441366 RepID=A0A8C5N7N8_GOUWI|nr:growth/differentiation factor 10-like [Gouania willdenowi]
MALTHLLLLMVNFFLCSTANSSFFRSSSGQLTDDLNVDVVYQHMHRLYEKYNQEKRLKEGNTVRSFRTSQNADEHRMVYWLNLTTLQDSEVILSATFHFLLDKQPHQKPWFCKRFKSPSCHPAAIYHSKFVRLILRSAGSEVKSGSLGSFLGNVTYHPHRREVWQMKDVSQVIKEAQHKGHLLVSVELDFGTQYQNNPGVTHSASSMPYLLLYANDKALGEPNSVVPSLQRYDPLYEGQVHTPTLSPELKGRARREANLPAETILNNELPEVDFKPDGYRKDDLWESTWYLTIKPKPKSDKKEKKRKNQEEDEQEAGREVHGHHVHREAERDSQRHKTDDLTMRKLQRDIQKLTIGDRRTPEGRKEGREGKKNKGSDGAQSPVLNFDEQTMRRARRRQWSSAPHRGCSRRNLRVDFADIGWSEWVIAPKAFDAYYCAGICGFPMPKVARPSNHATIQSIVRAVGIIPGVPEPCCVPEKMRPLAVLYQDESMNPVLKIYPNMSVQSCSCR